MVLVSGSSAGTIYGHILLYIRKKQSTYMYNTQVLHVAFGTTVHSAQYCCCVEVHGCPHRRFQQTDSPTLLLYPLQGTRPIQWYICRTTQVAYSVCASQYLPLFYWATAFRGPTNTAVLRVLPLLGMLR